MENYTQEKLTAVARKLVSDQDIAIHLELDGVGLVMLLGGLQAIIMLMQKPDEVALAMYAFNMLRDEDAAKFQRRVDMYQKLFDDIETPLMKEYGGADDGETGNQTVKLTGFQDEGGFGVPI